MREDYSPKAKLECCEEKQGEELLGRKIKSLPGLYHLSCYKSNQKESKNDSKMKLFNISIIMSCVKVKWKKSILL